MLLRNIGSIVRGKATPFHVISAAVLGSSLAFLPDFWAAPGLYVALSALLIVLNSNLFLAAMVAIPAKFLAIACLDFSLRVGEYLLEGPLQGLFKNVVNAPLLHYFGFERYIVSGGLVVGLGFGLAVGLVLSILLQRVRRGLASLEQNSAKYESFSNKGWVKALSFVFLGKRAKSSYSELATKKVGNPIRVWGLGLLVLGLGVAYLTQSFLGSAYLGAALKNQLERANGATVDLGGFDLDLAAARVQVKGLGVADPDNLEYDLLSGIEFDANVNTKELLRGRLVVDQLTVAEAASGSKRSVPGRRIERPQAEQAEDKQALDWGDYTLDEVLSEAEKVKAQLERVREWIERLAPKVEEVLPLPSGPGDPTLHERLRQRAKELGYSNLVAEHLFNREARIEVREISIAGFSLPGISTQAFTLSARNLSSAPALSTAMPELNLVSKDQKIRCDLSLGAASSQKDAKTAQLALSIRDMSVDQLTSGLLVKGQRPVSGGSIDIQLNGGLAPATGAIDLPLSVTLRNSTLSIPGVGSTQVDSFALPIGLRGPLDSLRIEIDDKQLVDALVAAGRAEFANRVRDVAKQQIAKTREEIKAELRARFGKELDGLGIDLDQIDNLEDLSDITDVAQLAEVAAAQKKAEVQAELTEQAKQSAQEAANELLKGQGQDLDKIGDKAAEEAKKKLGGLFKKP